MCSFPITSQFLKTMKVKFKSAIPSIACIVFQRKLQDVCFLKMLWGMIYNRWSLLLSTETFLPFRAKKTFKTSTYTSKKKSLIPFMWGKSIKQSQQLSQRKMSWKKYSKKRNLENCWTFLKKINSEFLYLIGFILRNAQKWSRKYAIRKGLTSVIMFEISFTISNRYLRQKIMKQIFNNFCPYFLR